MTNEISNVKTIEKISKSQAYVSLINFMKPYQNSDKGMPYTNTFYGPPYGSYNIPDDKYDIFYNLYKTAAMMGNTLHVIERQQMVGPLVFDFDFYFDIGHKERQYTDDHIKKAIYEIISVINKYYEITPNDLKLFVTEKKNPSYNKDKTGFKDGFHIIIPQPFNAIMRAVMSEEIMLNSAEKEIFSDIEWINPDGYQNIFDKAVAYRNGWLMYMSIKERGPIYELTKIYDGNNKLKNLELYDIDELILLFSVRQYSSDDEIIPKKKFTVNEKKEIYRVASKYSVPIPTNDKDNKNNKNNNDNNDNNKENNNDNDNKNGKKEKINNNMIHIIDRPYDTTNFDLAKRIVPNLSVNRGSTYAQWIEIGWALYNISDQLFDIFNDFSKKCAGYKGEDDCKKYWDKMVYKENGLNIGTLKWWLSQDNMAEYRKLTSDETNERILDSDFGRHDDIAMTLKMMYGHIYVCVSIPKNMWYEYQGNRWVLIEHAYTLHNKLSDEVSLEYGEIISRHLTEMCQQKKIDSDTMTKKFKTLQALLKNLKSSAFKNAVMEACRYRFYDPTFVQKLNTNTNLIGFNNGVYDLETRSFRKGTPDDYLTYTTKYDYTDKYSYDDPSVKDIEHFFSTVQPNKDIKNYLLTMIASNLCGEIQDHHLHFLTGRGCHAANTQIMMYDRTIKYVQDIKVGDKLLGIQNNNNYMARNVQKLFRGKQIMYKIIINDVNNKMEYIVNSDHRIALYNTFDYNKSIKKDICGTWKVTWFELIDDELCMNNCYALTKKSAINCLNKNIKENINFIRLGETIPIKISDYEAVALNNDIKKWFKWHRIINNKIIEYDFDVILMDEEGEQQYYGFQLDGNHKYLLGDMSVTYNSNGKSTIATLMETSFGDYYDTIPITLITQKRVGSSAANPELANKVGKRSMTMSETEHNDTIQIGYMKELTGGDKIQARPLFCEPFTFQPQFHLWVICNNLPEVPGTDDGTWRRIKVIHFGVQFVDVVVNPDFQRLKDTSIIERAKHWYKPFMWLLLNKYWPMYMRVDTKTGRRIPVPEPIEITKHTDKYKKDIDIYYAFVSENLIRTNNPNDTVTFIDVFSVFKYWYKEYYTNTNPPKNKLESYFEQIDIKRDVSNRLVGLRLKNN